MQLFFVFVVRFHDTTTILSSSGKCSSHASSVSFCLCLPSPMRQSQLQVTTGPSFSERLDLTSCVVKINTFLCFCPLSSQTEANQFTGMVYQGLLLSERKRLRTESIEEHVTPNSAPAQWPGNQTSFWGFSTFRRATPPLGSKSKHASPNYITAIISVNVLLFLCLMFHSRIFH